MKRSNAQADEASVLAWHETDSGCLQLFIGSVRRVAVLSGSRRGRCDALDPGWISDPLCVDSER